MPEPQLGDILGGDLPKPKSTVQSPLGGVLASQTPLTQRKFGDSTAMRKAIFDNVVDAVSKKYPVENTRYRLELRNPTYDRTAPYTLAEQKLAIMRGHSLDNKLMGEWALVDKTTGLDLDKRKSVIAHVPYATDRGTFIYQGSEYTVANQMRLKPGVFARIKDNGLIEAHVNVKPGTGPSFRVHMEPDTGIFRLSVGQSNLKLYPILRAMGASDNDIAATWGRELLQKNIEAEDPRAVSRAFSKLVATRADMAVSEVNTTSDDSIVKEAGIGAAEADRKWSYLWFRGKLVNSTHKGENWVLLETHKGLCEAAYDALKAEGCDCEPRFSNPHISVLRPEEVDELEKKFGNKWKGAAKIGQQMRFRIVRMVSLIPHSWKEMDRVWFIECESPDLCKYREELGFKHTPTHESTGHTMRFHITFAVHRDSQKAAELLSEKRAAKGVGEDLLPETTVVPPRDPQGSQILGVFNKMEMDPDVTEATLGERHTNVGVPLIMRTTKKLLNISNQTEDIDDRDSLAFQTLHSPEDFFAERIRKDAGQTSRKLLWKATLRGNLKHVPAGALTPQIRSVLLKSGMGMPIEEINPLDIMDQSLRVLRLGEGGIPSIDSVPDEARNVQPSHFGYLDPIRAPESEKIGVDSRIAHGATKGSDGQFYTQMVDARTGKLVPVSAQQAAKSIIAFPNEMDKPSDKYRAMVRSRQVEYVNKKDIDYVLPSPNQMFSAASNLVPLISGIKGGRLLMGAKYVIQALPLQRSEAPLVQNLAENGKSFDDVFGESVGALRAKEKGIVAGIDEAGIKVKYADGTTQTHEMYNNFPFNRKTFIHNTAMVKVGDRVAPGQLLAKSNYTDDNGTLAIGTNLRTAYMPYKGLNFEDAIVISESAAKKLSSEHMYQHGLEQDDNIDVGRKGFVSMYPTKFSREQLANVDERGVVRVGTKVQYGDPLLLALKKNAPTAVHKGHKALFSDGAMTWGHSFEGVVTDIDQTKDGGWNVVVKAYAPAQEGDKLAGRYGDKGVISKIVPDTQMIQDQEGRPMDILLNPLGVISRGNPSQVFETLLGKVARKRGVSARLPSFMPGSILEHVKAELQREGLSDTEDLMDPLSGKRVPKILTGERFIMKLHHTAESKGRGRDTGAYTSEGLPARGGEFGSKRISSMEQNAILSHGATEVLRDAQTVRGQRNDDFWRAFRMGHTPPSPKVPFVYEKLLGYMKGAGINIKKDGNRLQLFALSNKDIDKMSSGEITSSAMTSGEQLKEIPGGLFDRVITGGHGGDKWSHIKLNEPMPNPVMEEPIRQILGLTQKGYEEVISGQKPLNGKIGGEAIRSELSKIKLDDSIQYYRGVIQDGAKSKRDHAVKVLGYLSNLKKHNLRPEDWVMDKVPVLPPSMRPITSFRGMTTFGDANMLYKDMMLANESLNDLKGTVSPEQLHAERLQLYNGFKAVSGLGDPIQAKTLEKKVKGLLGHVFGVGSPKLGMFQRRVIGSPVDVVGRATITPNPDLNMDQVGLPESKAWTIYRPFIIRRLVRRGMPATEAAKAVANQAKVARDALQEEVEDRPVLINRAPTLHRYGFMAAWPVLVKGETLQLSPVVTGGFTADFDGDAMNYHVPVTDEAVTQAVEKMLPSRNLKAVKDFKVHYTPKNEFLLGLHLASSADNKNEPKIFRSKADALAAYKRGDIDLGDRISIK